MPSKRPILGGSVDPETRERWHAYVEHYDVSLSALLEAMGRLLEPGGRQPAWLERAVALASAVDDERRDRRPVD